MIVVLRVRVQASYRVSGPYELRLRGHVVVAYCHLSHCKQHHLATSLSFLGIGQESVQCQTPMATVIRWARLCAHVS